VDFTLLFCAFCQVLLTAKLLLVPGWIGCEFFSFKFSVSHNGKFRIWIQIYALNPNDFPRNKLKHLFFLFEKIKSNILFPKNSSVLEPIFVLCEDRAKGHFLLDRAKGLFDPRSAN